jgi:hypothetical protein
VLPSQSSPPHCDHLGSGTAQQAEELEAGAEDDELLVLEAEDVIVEGTLDDLLDELDTDELDVDELDTVEELLLEEALEIVELRTELELTELELELELRVELCVVLDCVGSQFGVVPVPEMQKE